MIPLVDLQRSHQKLAPFLRQAFRRVLSHGQFILGPEVSRFEKAFAQFCQSRYAVGVASGTDALELSLRALGVGPGDIAATVSFTFVATVDAILHVGAQPLFIDIDPGSFTMDPEDLERKLARLTPAVRRRVKAVIPVHLFGHPCDMDRLMAAARRGHLKVVEDAAQAAGAKWRSRPVGSFGEAGCFSFFPSKNLGALGDGGLCVTNSASLARKIKTLRMHGRPDLARQEVLGRNSRLDALQAAFLAVKLKRLSAWVRQRRRAAQLYHRELRGLPHLALPSEARHATHAYGLYVIRSPRREMIRRELSRRGVASQVYYPIPVHRQPIYRGRFGKLSLPRTERAAREVLALPIFPELTRPEITRICRVIRRALRSSR